MSTPDPRCTEPDDLPSFAPDFSNRVLRAADRVRRRRAMGSLAVLGLVALFVAGRTSSRPHLSHPRAQVAVRHIADLNESDFAWLEDVGTGTSTPGAVMFPEGTDTALAQSKDENLLVAVADDI